MTGSAAVVGADPEQPAQHVGDVTAEHAAVGVQLVDDDELELLEQLEPLGVVGQDRRVEHVRVGHDDLAGARGPSSGSAPACRRRRSTVMMCSPAGAGELAELGDLVLAERLGREQEEGARGRVLGDGLQDGQRVAQRLARRRRRDDDDVLAGVDRLDAPPPGGCTAARSRVRRGRRRSARSSQSGHRGEGGLARRDDGVVDDAAGQSTAPPAGGRGRWRRRRGRRCAWRLTPAGTERMFGMTAV